MAPMPEPGADQGIGEAEAALDTCLARIQAEDHQWNAMLALSPGARAAARAADAATCRGVSLGPLHGMVLALKDNIDVAGMATTSGCLALAQAMPLANAAVVDRLTAAGAVIVGKTNLSEFSFEVRSRSSLGGDVRCPHAPDATAGGSSGGSAVAAARGFAMAAIGTDTGGSIRIPAACNGLVGLRPAHGALPMAGIAPLAPSTDTVGPIARTVADAERIYRAMGGAVPDMSRKSAPRVGVLRQAFGRDPHIAAAAERALAALAQDGTVLVDPFEVPGIEALLAGPHIVDIEFAAAFDAYLAANFAAGTGPSSLAAILESGRFLADHRPSIAARLVRDPAEAGPVLERHRQLHAALVAAMTAHRLDALVFPTMQVVPEGLGNPPVGWAPELAPRTGWPAISVPAPVPAGTRPVGIELLAPAGRERLLFDLAGTIENA